MKALHRKDLYGWSVFDESRNLDFHSALWVRPEGNVVIDPLPLSAHDAAHLRSLGGVAWVVVTNSEHVRATRELVSTFGAKVAGPRAEADTFPLKCDRSLATGDALVPGLVATELHGSKTPGELALTLEDTTLVTGDLIRGHVGGRLNLLPEAKLKDPAKARASVSELVASWPRIDAVLVGDGWPVFRGGHAILQELVATLAATR
ncbi:MBL fold metallo-hydrolase [Archangium lansingense]|uniref:MBL fold metallo-hydrolase n=1 Tax=Archangium lansingense TaxID=2995310 RepID=A0ABT3ZZW0_9BACT|nr:MBL fold metallo-hydrolase [Archangium lansinium]MCY1074227.1 MBL fold metallo-hydrolase [Archangium lansinium]